MIPEIKRILYATDLSDNSAFAFRYAINSALKHDASVIVLHVFEPMSATNRSLIELYLDEGQRKKIFDERVSETMNRIRKRLQVLCDKEFLGAAACARKVEAIEVQEGVAAEVILKIADARNCDVIIMGTHGKGIIASTFLGSTAKRVLRRTRKPVFIVPLPEGETDVTFHDR